MFTEEDFQQSPVDTFGGVSFDAPPSVSSDGIVSALSANPTPAQTLSPSPTAVQKPGQAGVNRVNADTGNTGVVAYKDAKGQTVLTNVARDPNTNKDAPILPGVGTATVQGKPPAQITSNGLQPVSATTASFLAGIQSAKDPGELLANFNAFNDSAAQSKAQLEQNALEFAQNKLGVGQLQRQLMESQAADKADPLWYPGIGESPITKGLRAEIQTAISTAQTEAKNFLETNLTYASLSNSMSSAKLAYQDAQHRFTVRETKDYQNELRTQQRLDAQEQKDSEAASMVNPETLTRIQTLFPTAFSPTDATGNAVDPKLTAYRLMKGAGPKAKDLSDALQTDGDKLLTLAVAGNTYASTLIAAKEAKNMPGISTDDVQARIASMAKMADSSTLLKDWAKTQKDPKAAATMDMQLEALKDNKHEVTQRKVRMIQDIQSKALTDKFTGDVSSWGSSDPSLQVVIQKLRQDNMPLSVENAVTAYVGDKTGMDRAIAVNAFKTLVRDNANKFQNSQFGMPNPRVAESMVNQWAARGIVGQTWDKVKQVSMSDAYGYAPLPFAVAGPVLKAGQSLWNAANAPNAGQIDPVTGRKFGE